MKEILQEIKEKLDSVQSEYEVFCCVNEEKEAIIENDPDLIGAFNAIDDAGGFINELMDKLEEKSDDQ